MVPQNLLATAALGAWQIGLTGVTMQSSDLSDLVLHLTRDAMDRDAVDHQAQMADALRDIIPFDAAW